jgi:hypothetical protein
MELAGHRLLARQEEVAGDLHRDRARALLGAGGDVGERRPQHAQIVHTAVLIEPLVFGRQNGMFHDIRDFADTHDRPALLAELAQEVAVRRHHPQRDLGLVIGQCVERGERRPQQRQHERPEQRPDDGEAADHRGGIE